MQTHRWLNQSHPPNLRNAVILLYFNAAYSLLFGILGAGVNAYVGLPTLLGVAGAYGMANDKKWGYYLSCGITVLYFLLVAQSVLVYGFGALDLNIIFEIVLAILLFSKQTRAYVRLWFK